MLGSDVSELPLIFSDNLKLSTSDRFGGLLIREQQLATPNDYYRKIHPTEAAEVDARLGAEKAKAEAKARAASAAKPA